VPALIGLACPHWDRRAAGLWIGLSLDTDQQDMMQSLIEGVALRTAEAIRTMASLYRVSDEISIDGGVSANPYFCQFLADSLGKCVTVRPFSELTAIGTAQLAGAENILVDDENARIQRFHPSVFRQDRIEKFAQAVSRSMQWKD
jgi:glycerol kinase